MNKYIIGITMLLMTVVANAHAYVDPGSGGAIITAILGAVGAIGYSIRKYYYKIKRFFFVRKKDDPLSK